MTHIMLAHAPDSEARAAIVARKLGERGYHVRPAEPGYGPLSRRKLKADIDKAACVVVLWSREAADEPALHAAAQRARAQGKLAFARADTAAAPAGLRVKAANLSNWMGAEASSPWRDLSGAVRRVAAVPAPTRAPSAKPAPARSTPRAVETPRAVADEVAAPAKKKGGALGIVLTLLALAAAAGGGAYYYFVVMGGAG